MKMEKGQHQPEKEKANENIYEKKKITQKGKTTRSIMENKMD